MKRALFLLLLCNSLYATDALHHVFTGIILVILIVVVLILSNTISIKNIKQKKQSKQKDKIILNYIDDQEIIIKTRHFDIRENLLYFFKTLNYDATKNNNTFLSDINLEAENTDGKIEECHDLQGDPELIILAMNTIIQIFNKKLHRSTMLIKLDMFGIDDDLAYFDFTLSLYSTNWELIDEILSDMGNKESKLYEKLAGLRKTLTYIKGSDIAIDKEERTIGFKFTIPRCIDRNIINASNLSKQQPINNYSSLNVYIAHDDSLIVRTIKSSLDKESMPLNGVLTLEKFIDFTHNSVSQSNITNAFFVATDFLKKIEHTHKNSLYNMHIEKSIKIFAVANNYSDVDYIKHNFSFVEIMMLPYTNDYFEVIVNHILDKYEK